MFVTRAIQLSRIPLVGGVCNPDLCGETRAPIPDNALRKSKTEWLWFVTFPPIFSKRLVLKGY